MNKCEQDVIEERINQAFCEISPRTAEMVEEMLRNTAAFHLNQFYSNYECLNDGPVRDAIDDRIARVWEILTTGR
jgi:hypothetical protein